MQSIETIELFHKFPLPSLVAVGIFSYFLYKIVCNRHDAKSRSSKAATFVFISFCLVGFASDIAFYFMKKPFLIFNTQGICYQRVFNQSYFIKWDDVKKIIVHRLRPKLLSFSPRCVMEIQSYDGSYFSINDIDYHKSVMWSIVNKYLPADQLQLLDYDGRWFNF